MKMLCEGKERVSMYRVYYLKDNSPNDIYLEAVNAQEAANAARRSEDYDPSVEIVEVAKVVNNWK